MERVASRYSPSGKTTKDIDNQNVDTVEVVLTEQLKRCKIYTSLSLLIGMGCCLLYDSPGLHPKLNEFIIAMGLYCAVNCTHYFSLYRCVTTRPSEVRIRLASRAELIEGNDQAMRFPPLNPIREVESLSSLASAARHLKTLAHYCVFIWGNVVYFESANVDCSSSFKTIGMVLLCFGYVFCGFMLIGVGLTVLSLVVYCPYWLVTMLWSRFSQWRKRRNLLRTISYYATQEQTLEGCRVCMSGFESGQRQYMPCRSSRLHRFHRECLIKWMAVRLSCPICRSDF